MFWQRKQGPSDQSVLVREGYEAWEAERWAEAGGLLAQAAPVETDPRQAAILWFDAALAYKFARDWQKAYELGKEAASRVPRGVQNPAFWNLGIAATVLKDWKTARDAWDGYGVGLPAGEGEINEHLGATCVRIRTDAGEEVVWAVRLCPTRARVTSVPFHPSRRFGEIVLHDGAPNGERVMNEQRYPVFDELMLFAPSESPTLAVQVTTGTDADTEALSDLFQDNGFGAEPLSSRINLCKCCSEGSVAQEPSFEAGSQQVLLGGVAQEPARALLDRWREAAPEARSWTNLHVLQAMS